MEYALSDITDDGPFLNLWKDIIIIVGCLICNNIYIVKKSQSFFFMMKIYSKLVIYLFILYGCFSHIGFHFG